MCRRGRADHRSCRNDVIGPCDQGCITSVKELAYVAMVKCHVKPSLAHANYCCIVPIMLGSRVYTLDPVVDMEGISW